MIHYCINHAICAHEKQSFCVIHRCPLGGVKHTHTIKLSRMWWNNDMTLSSSCAYLPFNCLLSQMNYVVLFYYWNFVSIKKWTTTHLFLQKFSSWTYRKISCGRIIAFRDCCSLQQLLTHLCMYPNILLGSK